MAVKTRKEVREQLGSVLSTALTGDGNPVYEVHDYMKSTFDSHSPVLAIGSSGLVANPEVQQFGPSGWFPTYYFELLTFVARKGDEMASEDELDEVAQALYETLETNQVLDGWWAALSYGDRSTIEDAMVGGEPYWMEITPIMVEVYG